MQTGLSSGLNLEENTNETSLKQVEVKIGPARPSYALRRAPKTPRVQKNIVIVT